jgi:hypothetical protein
MNNVNVLSVTIPYVRNMCSAKTFVRNVTHGFVMTNKLCCVLTPFVSCEVCKGQWCMSCWTDRPDEQARTRGWGPNRFAGHKDVVGSSAFSCKGILVNADGIEPPLILKRAG